MWSKSSSSSTAPPSSSKKDFVSTDERPLGSNTYICKTVIADSVSGERVDLVDIRKIFERDGKRIHTKKGISIPQRHFNRIDSKYLRTFVGKKVLAQPAKLTKNVYLDISQFKGKLLFDIRKCFKQEDGKLNRSYKGIALDPQVFARLVALVDEYKTDDRGPSCSSQKEPASDDGDSDDDSSFLLRNF